MTGLEATSVYALNTRSCPLMPQNRGKDPYKTVESTHPACILKHLSSRNYGISTAEGLCVHQVLQRVGIDDLLNTVAGHADHVTCDGNITVALKQGGDMQCE